MPFGCEKDLKRVLMISKALVVGAYHKKLEEIVKSGVELHLVVPCAWGGQKLEILEGNGYKIHCLKIVFNCRNHFHFYRGLSKTLEELKPDIVHIDEEHYSIVTFQAMRLAKRAGAKTLFFTWQNIYKKYPFPFSWIERYNLRNADAAIAGNIESKEALRSKGFTGEVAVIPQFGVDPDMFRPADTVESRQMLGIGADGFVIGFMGRLVEEKGIFTLLDAASRIKDCTLLLIGSGPLKQEILKKAGGLGISGRVKAIDQVSSMKVPGYLNCFDCLVLPSLTRPNWKEQFGRVLIEAMSCEVPVIGSDSGEIPNVIGDAGLIFREGDAADLARKLRLMAGDKGLRKALGKKGRARVMAEFTQRKVAEDTCRVYKTLTLG